MGGISRRLNSPRKFFLNYDRLLPLVPCEDVHHGPNAEERDSLSGEVPGMPIMPHEPQPVS